MDKNIYNKNNFDNKSDKIDKNDIFNNMYNQINLSNINLIYNIDYLTYKKKLINLIVIDLELIFNSFNEEINDILINIYILKKKYKISNDNFLIFKIIYDLIFMLNKIIFIDQEEYLLILLYIYKINILTKKINIFFNNFIFKELIDYKLLITTINNLFEKLCKNNIILNIFCSIINLKDEKLIKNNIIILSKILSIDYFMYYNSRNIYNKIMNNILDLTNLIKDNLDDQLGDRIDIPSIILKKNEFLFLNLYEI
jgi:hypothetical protein